MRRAFFCVILLGLIFFSFNVALAKVPIQPKPPTYPTEYPIKEVDDLFLTKEPWVEVNSDGTALVHWSTEVPTPGGRVYYGVYLPDQELDYPRFRKVALEEVTEFTKEHVAKINIKTFEKHKYNAARFVEKGEGVIAYRVEVFDPVKCTTRAYDRRFRFKKVGDTYIKALTITEGPFVDQVTTNSAIISWETDAPSLGCLVVNGEVYIDSENTIRHEVKVEGLNPGTVYEYTVLSYDASTDDLVTSRKYHLKTVPENAEVFKFAFLSDSREGVGGGERNYKGVNHRILTELFTDAFRKGADFIVFAGDLINGYTSNLRDFQMQLEAWKQTVEPIGHYIPIYEAMGNHDAALMLVYDDGTEHGVEFDKIGEESAEEVFRKEFVNPENGPEPEGPGLPTYKENVYSFDYGNTHIVVFNTNYWWSSQPEKYGGNLEGYIMNKQMEWIEQDLSAARARGIKHILMFGHEPAFPNGGHVKDAMCYNFGVPEKNNGIDRAYVIEMRDRFWEIVSKYHVLAVCFGDEHNYNRTLIDSKTPVYLDGSPNPNFVNPVWQIISGDAGAPFYAQNKDVPWVNDVQAFSLQCGYALFSIEGDKVFLTAYSHTGQILDKCELTAIK